MRNYLLGLGPIGRQLGGLREFIDDYPFDEIALKALKGRDAVYPFGEIATYGSAALGSGGL